MKVGDHYVYISPHLDDAIYSVGGLIRQATHTGASATIVTIFAADPTSHLSDFALSLHKRFGASLGDSLSNDTRRSEDRAAAKILGANVIHLPFQDCIYRSDNGFAIYPSEQSLFESIHQSELNIVDRVSEALADAVDSIRVRSASTRIFGPLGLGGHVDHTITAAACDTLGADFRFEDYPYSTNLEIQDIARQAYSASLVQWNRVDADSIDAWGDAICAYRSQLNTFWDSGAEARRALGERLTKSGHLLRLWSSSR